MISILFKTVKWYRVDQKPLVHLKDRRKKEIYESTVWTKMFLVVGSFIKVN